MSRIRSIRDLALEKKRVFLRADFNVPLDSAGNITDLTRIEEALPTIQYLREQGAKIILASHLGRPDGKRDKAFSLEPIAKKLCDILNTQVLLAEDSIGDGVELMAKGLGPSEMMLLENLRFHAAEEKCDPGFSKKLAQLCEVYVNDAFGTCHRKHASVFGLPQLMKEKAPGFLIEKEMKALDQLLDRPARPYFAILGGAKVSDKIKTVLSMMSRIDGLLVGGAMAYAFYQALKKELPHGAKPPKAADIQAAHEIIKLAANRNCEILLPIDTVDSFDIGPKTIALFSEKLRSAKTIFWNGPLGYFEKSPYEKGTFEIAKILSEIDAYRVVGGGDSVAAIQQAGLADSFDHLSTGGGASLEYLEGNSLPGISVFL